MSTLDDVNSLLETADYLKMTTRKLASLATGRAPKIGSIKQGRTRTFPRSAIEAYIEANTIAPGPSNPHGLTDGALRNLNRRT
jgi:hypothetical protein